MSSSYSNDLLSALVENIRLICEKHITFTNFTSVSGLICFDIDGSKQQCFVISELLQKRSAGEGYSAHLKTLSWKDIDEKKAVEWSCRETPETLHKEKCDTPFCDQAEVAKSLSGLQGSYANLQTKLDWCNRTFILKPLEPDKGEPNSINSVKKISTTTITVSQTGDLKELKGNSRLSPKKGVYSGSLREWDISGGRWPKCSYGQKKNTHYKNCYPCLPQKPVKRYKVHERLNNVEVKRYGTSNDSKCEPLKEIKHHQNNFKDMKAPFCPGGKPTALSWFETMISPSSSVESIDSIQPCYLVPCSEPLSQPHQYKGEFKNMVNYTCSDYTKSVPHNIFPKTDTTSRFKISSTVYGNERDEMQDRTIPPTAVKLDSPLKTIPPHSTISNGTLNTISSIEPDITVKGNSPDRSMWKSTECAINTPLSPGEQVQPHATNESSTIIKKRASLLKWMGLFKNRSKTSSNEESRVQKQVTKLRTARSTPDPPITIRLKQWN